MSIYKSLSELYNRMQDDESREIFRNRTLFSLTNEQHYMDEIIKNISEIKFFQHSNNEAYRYYLL